MPESVPFDRAAAYYDETRGLDPEIQAQVALVLAAELAGRTGRCLEVGVGTGRMALPLHELGVAMAGVDLSRPMLARLVEKSGGAPPFPLAIADGMRVPFVADGLGAALVVHVLHLVRDWPSVVRELVRVVRPGGVVIVNLGGGHGLMADVSRVMVEAAGPAAQRIGLTDPGPLDELMTELGAAPVRLLDPVMVDRATAPIDVVERFAGNRFSSTWPLADDVRMAAAEVGRRWVLEHYDDPHVERPDPFPVTFRAYDL